MIVCVCVGFNIYILRVCVCSFWMMLQIQNTNVQRVYTSTNIILFKWEVRLFEWPQQKRSSHAITIWIEAKLLKDLVWAFLDDFLFLYCLLKCMQIV